MIEKYIPVKECCGGYEMTEDGNHCIPVCDPPCDHGTCIMPNICRCDKYFDGQLCDTSIRKSQKEKVLTEKIDNLFWVCLTACPQGWHGPGCTQMCQCLNNGLCNPINGKNKRNLTFIIHS